MPLDPAGDSSPDPIVEGAVLGVDVGFSPNRRSSAVCKLRWNAERIAWSIQRFRALAQEREDTIMRVAGDEPLAAAAFDGPLRRGFDVIGMYRAAERMLTRRLGTLIGKPGQASAPVGKSLNAAANDCAHVVMTRCKLMSARHAISIDAFAAVEAFPSSFLGVMLERSRLPAAKRNERSDIYFRSLEEAGVLQSLLAYLLPGRLVEQSMKAVTNHDDRAALVCALTALAVAVGDYTAVGDGDGWIILPPRAFVKNWAWGELEANAQDEKSASLYRTSRT